MTDPKQMPYRVSTSLIVVVWVFCPRLAYWLMRKDYT